PARGRRRRAARALEIAETPCAAGTGDAPARGGSARSGAGRWHRPCFAAGTCPPGGSPKDAPPDDGRHRDQEGAKMGGKMDEAKGRAKQAAGAASGDRKLEREGRADRTAGRVKQKAERAVDKARAKLRGR